MLAPKVAKPKYGIATKPIDKGKITTELLVQMHLQALQSLK